MTTNPTPRVTASIVAHRTDPVQLRRAAACVLRSPLVEWLHVVDNSPSPSLRSELEPSPRIIYSHVENRGFGAGHNLAMRRSLRDGADSHLVLNADVWWEGDILSPLARHMASRGDVGMMMPLTFYPDGDLQLTARRLPTPLDVIAKRFLPKALTGPLISRYLLADADHSRPIDSPYLLGSCLLFRCEALRSEGLFDERFFMYPEDIDITRRIHEHWRTLLWPEVSIIHEHAAASRRNLRMLRIHIVNMVRYFNKWGWWVDPLRRRANLRLMQSLTLLPENSRPPQRG